MMHCREQILRFKHSARGLLTAALFLGGATLSYSQVSLSTVVSLALRNSNVLQMAQADILRASGGVSEAKDAYVPNFVLGSGLGYSYGFPVGQPSIYNVTSQALVY